MRKVSIMLALLVGAMPASAAERVLTLQPGEAYRHAPSGLQLPAELDGVPRVRAISSADEQLDDTVQYESADSAEVLTVFVFRHVTGSVPVWFDRIRAQIGDNTVYGEVTTVDAPAPFTPPHQANASALMQSFVTGKGPYRGTAAALIPLGPDWYVAVRYSSRTLSAAALAEHMARVAAAIGWPEKIAEQPVAALIAPCDAPLAFAAGAKEQPVDGATVIGNAMMLVPVPDDKKLPATEPPSKWCRDATVLDTNAAVYRPVGSSDSYLIAFGDAGRGIAVAPDVIGAEIHKSKKPNWMVSLVALDQSAVYPTFDAFPTPAAAFALVNRGKRLAWVTTWGKNTNVNITPEALKK
jgi:hypothetical protein